MSVGTVAFNDPTLSFSASVLTPVTTDADMDGVATIRLMTLMSASLTLFLATIKEQYAKGRSMGDDQAGIYRSLEEKITTNYGLDGRGCLLRFICELQSYPIRDWTMAGEVIATVFTPRDTKDELLHEYREAQWAGLQGPPSESCWSYSSRCPVSIFKHFNPEDDLGYSHNELENYFGRH